jgi:transcriptional regulator with XRE-family HTH domain
MYVGKRIKQLRHLLNLNQKEFSEALGVSQAYYSVIESGKKKISKKMLLIIKEKWPVGVDILEGKSIKTVGGILGGVDGGLNGTPDIFRLYKDLEKERPDLIEMTNIFSDFKRYFEASALISNTYFIERESALNNIKSINYSDYKKKAIKHLDTYLKYQKAMKPIAQALKQFIEKDFPALDEKGILSNPDQD